MGKLPEIVDRIQLPLEIPIHPHLTDHRFMGRAVLPGVEAMQHLASAVHRRLPDVDPRLLSDIRFEKFLYIPTGETRIQAFADIETHAGGAAAAHLRTRFKSKKTTISRTITHASVRFPAPSHSPPAAPDAPPPIEGPVFQASPEKIYQDLVPFGSAYRNIIAPLHLTGNGAMARVSGGSAKTSESLLGSPFPLDAAFHAACAWGQRHFNLVAFPVTVQTRYIPKPTLAEQAYTAVVIPRDADPALIVFDIFLYDEKDTLRETAFGVHMRDVSGGRLKPPGWISRS